MNQIHYFANTNGMHFAAVAPGQFSEVICLYDEQTFSAARIDFSKGSHHSCSYYESIQNGYFPCCYKTYKEARLLALAELLSFVGDLPEFTTPSTRPLFVDRPNSHHMVNDLPF